MVTSYVQLFVVRFVLIVLN